jgi:hypothetical protein
MNWAQSSFRKTFNTSHPLNTGAKHITDYFTRVVNEIFSVKYRFFVHDSTEAETVNQVKFIQAAMLDPTVKSEFLDALQLADHSNVIEYINYRFQPFGVRILPEINLSAEPKKAKTKD